MNVKSVIKPLAELPDSPVEGEDVLTSMSQWVADDQRRPGSLAGLVELNWVARDHPGSVYDLVSGHQGLPLHSLTVDQALQMLVSLEERGLALELLYFTGADPAGHPQIGDFVDLARQRGISRIGLQCSGVRIANDDYLLDKLVRLKPLLFVEFDGFDETASLILRGRRDLPFETRRGLDRLAVAGLPAALLANVVQGVNLHEVGAIADFGLKHPAVFSAIFRPIPPRLNRLGASPSSHVTAANIMAALERQSDGLFRQDAFAPALSCRPRQYFYAQVPYSARNGTPLADDSRCIAPNGASSCFWLGVHEFMAPWNNDFLQVRRCSLVIMTPDGRTIPYCLYDTEDEL